MLIICVLYKIIYQAPLSSLGVCSTQNIAVTTPEDQAERFDCIARFCYFSNKSLEKHYVDLTNLKHSRINIKIVI